MNVVYEKVMNELNNTKNALGIVENANKHVVVFVNKNEMEMYAVVDGDYNMISESVHNILPMPSISIVKTMSYNEAATYVKTHSAILNGMGVRFKSEVIAYKDYIKNKLKHLETTATLIEGL